MLKFLIGKDWVANRNEIFRLLAEDVRNRKGNRILLVPELISHECERLLCATAGDTASRYAEVLSFSRLVRRVSDYAGTAIFPCLDDGGRIVSMAAVSRNLSSRLKAYAAMETNPEFLSDLTDAIDEFKRCCITSQVLSNASDALEGSIAQKLEELSLIMESYDAMCMRGKRDPRDQMTWLLEKLEECDFAEKHTFYIDGFPDFTRQNMAILEHIIQSGADITVSLNCDQIGSALLAFEKSGNTAQEILQIAQNAGIETTVKIVPGRDDALTEIREKIFQGTIAGNIQKSVLQTVHSDTPFGESMWAVHSILDLVKNNYRYREICVVCGDLETYKPLLEMIFQRYHIPFYCSGTEPILQKSVISTVLLALDAAQSGFDTKSMLRYLRSALSPLDPDLCDLIENYVTIWGIRGKKWLQTWENHPEGLGYPWEDTHKQYLSLLNEARAAIMEPLTHLREGFHQARTVRDQVVCIYNFLSEINLEERLDILAREMDASGDHQSAQVLNQLWEILLEALEQLYDVLGETQWEEDHFTRLFRLLLSQYKVGTIPPVLDAVQIGAVSAMRCNTEKHLIILGAEEGKLPGYSGSSGVLTDQERVALRNLGVPLTGGAMEGIQAEFAEIYGVFNGAKETIRVSYSGDQPSYLFRRLAVLSGNVQPIQDTMGFALADPFEASAFLAQWNEDQKAYSLKLDKDYHQILDHKNYSLGSVSKNQIRNLYGKTLNLSASQIDRFAECHLS